MGSDPEKDLERGVDPENGTSRTESTYHSDIEKAESNAVDEGGVGTPDPDHEEVEQMDAGHLDDLARQHVSPQYPSALPRQDLISTDYSIYQSRPSKGS
jgi:hypothetical protein